MVGLGEFGVAQIPGLARNIQWQNSVGVVAAENSLFLRFVAARYALCPNEGEDVQPQP